MKLDKFRNNIGIPLRLYPIPKMGNRRLPDQRNQWMLVSEEDKGFNVLNLVMKHEFLLTRDNIHDYREPQIIILRSQIILTEDGGVDFIPFADAPNHELLSLQDGTFEGSLTIGMSVPDYSKELKLPVVNREDLPSHKAAEKIRRILAERPVWLSGTTYDSVWHAGALMSSPLVPAPYEARSTKTLKENLANVRKTYVEHDMFELYESRAHKINIHLLNEGSEYIEDARIQLKIERCSGLIVAEEIHAEPPEPGSLVNMPVGITTQFHDDYPDVIQSAEAYSVVGELGDIRHGQPTRAFEEPLRILVTEEARGHTIKIQCSIHGRNLRSPRKEELAITVV